MDHYKHIGKHRTTVRFSNGAATVRYWNTDVVTDEGSVKGAWCTLNHGGWKTATTKKRMNQAAKQFGLCYQVFQSKFDWFVQNTKTGLVVPYGDGQRFSFWRKLYE